MENNTLSVHTSTLDIQGARKLQQPLTNDDLMARAPSIFAEQPWGKMSDKQVRRVEDQDPTLWNTFNVVQENLVKGGLRVVNPETSRRSRTRGVTSISENAKLNKALWVLAESMQNILSGVRS